MQQLPKPFLIGPNIFAVIPFISFFVSGVDDSQWHFGESELARAKTQTQQNYSISFSFR
jgi:hypothetical protein